MSAVNYGNYSDDPFGVVADSSETMVNVLEVFASILDLPDLVESAETIVSLPPEKRFTEAKEIYEDLLRDSEGNGTEYVENTLPTVKKEVIVPRLLSTIQDILSTLEEDTLEGILVDRNNDRGYLVLSLYLEKTRQVFSDIELYRDDECLETLISTGVALYSRIFLISLREENEITEDMLRDIVRAEYYRKKAISQEFGDNPEKLPISIVEKKILLEGATLAYTELDISVSRGAELAGVSSDEFEAALVEKGIRPEYGPANEEELFGDDDWMNAGTEDE